MKNLIVLALLVAIVRLVPSTAIASTTQAATAPAVSIVNFAFNPATLTVRVGDTVTFVNKDDETHTATATGGDFDSGRLDQNASFSYTFTKPGTYSYYCRIHTSMKGTIVVQAVGK